MPTKDEKKPKKCFVIGPIGDEGSEVRNKADWLLLEIIKPVLEADNFDYVVKRSDEISEPGMITDQVISSVLDDALVIADLTGHNPNAFYELAIRHMVGGRTIHMAEEGQSLPFDIKDYRAIFYKTAHPSDLARARDALAEQVKAIENPDYKAENPITKARGFQNLSQSSDSKDKMLAMLVGSVSRMDARLEKVEKSVSVQTTLSPLQNVLLVRALKGQPTVPDIASGLSPFAKVFSGLDTPAPEKTLGELITPESASMKSALEKTLGEILTPESEPKKKKND